MFPTVFSINYKYMTGRTEKVNDLIIKIFQSRVAVSRSKKLIRSNVGISDSLNHGLMCLKLHSQAQNI